MVRTPGPSTGDSTGDSTGLSTGDSADLTNFNPSGSPDKHGMLNNSAVQVRHRGTQSPEPSSSLVFRAYFDPHLFPAAGRERFESSVQTVPRVYHTRLTRVVTSNMCADLRCDGRKRVVEPVPQPWLASVSKERYQQNQKVGDAEHSHAKKPGRQSRTHLSGVPNIPDNSLRTICVSGHTTSTVMTAVLVKSAVTQPDYPGVANVSFLRLAKAQRS